MSAGTKIEWTEATWNPVTGCDWVSPGCDFCYARDLAKRLKAMGNPRYTNDGYDKALKVVTPGFGVTLHPDKLDEPLKRKKPTTYFVNSMSDLFHEEVLKGTVTDRFGATYPFLAEVFATMVRAKQHTFQVLTKRPRIMAAILSEPMFKMDVNGILLRECHPVMKGGFETPWPSNIWLGTSVEDQKRADLRIPSLLDTPAAVRFLSCEPLLGPIDLRLGIDHVAEMLGAPKRPLHWVIVGGESGPKARHMDESWPRALRDQCVEAGVPFFFKQWGAFLPAGQDEAAALGCDHEADFIRVGKHKAGRILDGRTWDEMPERVSA